MVISIIKTALNNNVIVSWSSLWGGGESTQLPKVTRKLNYKRLFPGADPAGGAPGARPPPPPPPKIGENMIFLA